MIGMVLASLFLLACLTCQTFKCLLMLQEVPHLEPILMAFGLPSNCLRALFIQSWLCMFGPIVDRDWIQFLWNNCGVTDAISKCFLLWWASLGHSFWVSTTHIPGGLNSIADALSFAGAVVPYVRTPGFSWTYPCIFLCVLIHQNCVCLTKLKFCAFVRC